VVPLDGRAPVGGSPQMPPRVGVPQPLLGAVLLAAQLPPGVLASLGLDEWLLPGRRAAAAAAAAADALAPFRLVGLALTAL